MREEEKGNFSIFEFSGKWNQEIWANNETWVHENNNKDNREKRLHSQLNVKIKKLAVVHRKSKVLQKSRAYKRRGKV